MSDQISQLDLHKMQHQVKVCEADFRYAARSNDRGIACAIKIPYPLFIIWRNLKRDECATIQTDISYVDFLEQCIPGQLFAFSDDQKIRKDIDNNLSKIADIIAQMYKKARGRAKKELDSRCRRFNIFEGQTRSVQELEADVGHLKSELENWKDKYENLEKAKEELYNEMIKEINIRERIIAEQSDNNNVLKNYIALLEKSEGVAYTGKPVSDVANKSRSLKQYLSRVE